VSNSYQQFAEEFDWLGYGQNWLIGHTAGVLWSAKSATVDPWTKANMVHDDAVDLMRASGGTLSASAALAQASQAVTATLKAAGADPSQESEYDALKQLGNIVGWVAIIAALYLAIQLVALGKSWKDVLSP